MVISWYGLMVLVQAMEIGGLVPGLEFGGVKITKSEFTPMFIDLINVCA